MTDGRPRKLQRASRACDFCHKRSIKCKPSDVDSQRCQNCVDFDIACTYTRPWRRARGPATAPAAAGASGSNPSPEANGYRKSSTQYSHSTQNTQGSQSDRHQSPGLRPESQAQPAETQQAIRPEVAHTYRTTRGKPEDRHLTAYTNDPLGEAWKAFALASHSTIVAFAELYFITIYPIYPLFHRKTFLEKVRRRDYLNERGFYASTMAACALVAARARDGALLPGTENLVPEGDMPPETFYAAAKDSIPKDFTSATGMHYLRACALIAVASIQFSKIDAMHEYLGRYHTLVALQRFYDEAHWPKDITVIEREERRRLFWSTYTLDVYSAIVWNGQLHSREAHVHVGYPTEADDDHLEEAPVGLQDPQCWMHGWNFTIDIYRVMEHATNRLRSHRNVNMSLRPVQTFFTPESFSAAGLLQSVFEMCNQLPPAFKEIRPITGDQKKDIFGFQAANAQATVQLLRMVLFSIEDTPDVEQKCNVAAELLAVFQSVPVAYLKAISTPLIYHLAGIGTILGSVIETALSETSYQRVRSMLLSMADLLESLESGLTRNHSTSRGLRLQVDRIDEYMRVQRAQLAPSFQNTIADITGAVPPPRQPFLPSNGIENMAPRSQIQLPPELLEDWPWAGDFYQQDYGPFPFGFD
ncbi:hypothetical protein HDK77DRAFT_225608 [Phyllosticta capitalensis]|uniref:Zn(2)-C6 fungal-type domain-containing protein n=1 Tax=Phyllosticta capitalensis TaxID=121624 RepID=A0ABR1Z4P3_9PEZI